MHSAMQRMARNSSSYALKAQSCCIRLLREKCIMQQLQALPACKCVMCSPSNLRELSSQTASSIGA
jgi:hypothetical protein